VDDWAADRDWEVGRRLGESGHISSGVDVNDVQSQLNATRVDRVVKPTSLDEVRTALKAAKRDGLGVCIAGGRHSMGGQQFGTGCVLLDMTSFNRVESLDSEKGIVEAEAGIEWPELIDWLHREQAGSASEWSIREKQTGVDRVTLGGSLSSNVHGRGLGHPPMIADVESFDIVNAAGELLTCGRNENRELFSLAIGGYGLFGVITKVRLRLSRRTKVERVVEVIALKDLISKLQARRAEGFLFGDCQYSTDLDADVESHPGVFACYRPVPADSPMPEEQKQLSGEDWARLYTLARTDKRKAFEVYSDYYLSTSGQTYWSDTHQLAGDFEDYRQAVDEDVATEVLTEVYVSHESFLSLLAAAREDFILYNADMTYGTIRFVEQDRESFLPWARMPSVCVVCNLHVVHTDEGKAKAIADFRRIIDRAIEFGGSFFLTYHRWATREQVEACYPEFRRFLELKKKYDPGELFQSDWYRHYRDEFATERQLA
jgi:FAD/FMN-containing dehydrogenase